MSVITFKKISIFIILIALGVYIYYFKYFSYIENFNKELENINPDRVFKNMTKEQMAQFFIDKNISPEKLANILLKLGITTEQLLNEKNIPKIMTLVIRDKLI